MSFYTTEEQIHELFSRCGEIRRIVMGLDKFKKTPCGFCFLEYYHRPDAENSMRFINGTRLDDRIVRVDWDAGFIEGRQYGRGKSGGQVRKYFNPKRLSLQWQWIDRIENSNQAFCVKHIDDNILIITIVAFVPI